MVQTSTIATIGAATLATGFLGYAIYFDQQRRRSADFRRSLRRNERRQARAEKESTVESRKAWTQQIHAAVDAVLADGLPADVNEREAFCMEHIQLGETLAADPARTLDAALAFYKALKVYPTPNDLISIYDKVVDKRVLDVLAVMMAYDQDLEILPDTSGSNGMPPHPGLD